MKSDNQDKVIELLKQDGWQSAGNTYIDSYKIITAKSYPLAGAIITTGGKPKFEKNGWTACVGKKTTTFYKKPAQIKHYPACRTNLNGYVNFEDWQTDNIPTKEIDRIIAKMRECV